MLAAGDATFQAIRTAGFVVSFAVVLAIQALAPYRRGGIPGSNWRQNIPIGAINAALTGLVCGGCLSAAAAYAETRGAGVLRAGGLSGWVAVIVAIPALDLVLWGWHAANHRVRWLWRLHRVHHADDALDLTTAVRFHPGEILLSLPVRVAAIAALGAPVAAVLAFEAAFGLFNLFVHGNIRLPGRLEGPLQRLIILPATHRVHHSVRPDEHHRNFGTILSVWDRMFGTFTEGRSADAVTMGLAEFGGGRPPGVWRSLALPFARGRVDR